MSHSNGTPARTWRRPIAVWAALVLLALAGLGSAYLPLHGFNTAVNLVIAGIMVILLWLFLMDLVSAEALIGLIAVSGAVWLSFMFALTFSDYLSRACESPGGGPPGFCADQNIDRRGF